jgi:lipoyl-dependent peroxiredoxin subunit D
VPLQLAARSGPPEGRLIAFAPSGLGGSRCQARIPLGESHPAPFFGINNPGVIQVSIDSIRKQIPDFAKDLRINLGNVLDVEQAGGMNAQQLWATALATAIASRNKVLAEAIAADAVTYLDQSWLDASRAAAAIMGMNNIYYRFVHLTSNDEYAKMPARLRMTVIGNPGIERADFELLSLAVSAVNGCGMCVDSHEQILKKAGVSAEVIQHSVRIASVVHAVAGVLDMNDLAAFQAAA